MAFYIVQYCTDLPSWNTQFSRNSRLEITWEKSDWVQKINVYKVKCKEIMRWECKRFIRVNEKEYSFRQRKYRFLCICKFGKNETQCEQRALALNMVFGLPYVHQAHLKEDRHIYWEMQCKLPPGRQNKRQSARERNSEKDMRRYR